MTTKEIQKTCEGCGMWVDRNPFSYIFDSLCAMRRMARGEDQKRCDVCRKFRWETDLWKAWDDMKKKKMTAEQRRAYWRAHFAQRLAERYGYQDDKDVVYNACQAAVATGEATQVDESGPGPMGIDIYRVDYKLEDKDGVLAEEVYVNVDVETGIVTTCLPPENFERS